MLNQSKPLDLAFQALADPSRRAIVARLTLGPASVSELARPLAMSFPAVMQHLAVLEGARLVRSQKVGRVRTCRIDAATLQSRRGLAQRPARRVGAPLRPARDLFDRIASPKEAKMNRASNTRRRQIADDLARSSPRRANSCSRPGAAPSISSAGSAPRASMSPRRRSTFAPAASSRSACGCPTGPNIGRAALSPRSFRPSGWRSIAR